MAYGKRLNIYIGNRKSKIMLSCSGFPVNLSFLLANTVFCPSNKYLLCFLWPWDVLVLSAELYHQSRKIHTGFLCSNQKHVHTVILLIILIFKYWSWLAQWQYWKLICSVVPVWCCEYQTDKKSNGPENVALCSLIISFYPWFSFEPLKKVPYKVRKYLKWHLRDQSFSVYLKVVLQILLSWSLQKFGSVLQSSWRVLCWPSSWLALLKLSCVKISYTRIWDWNWLLVWERTCSSLFQLN